MLVTTPESSGNFLSQVKVRLSEVVLNLKARLFKSFSEIDTYIESTPQCMKMIQALGGRSATRQEILDSVDKLKRNAAASLVVYYIYQDFRSHVLSSGWLKGLSDMEKRQAIEYSMSPHDAYSVAASLLVRKVQELYGGRDEVGRNFAGSSEDKQKLLQMISYVERFTPLDGANFALSGMTSIFVHFPGVLREKKVFSRSSTVDGYLDRQLGIELSEEEIFGILMKVAHMNLDVFIEYRGRITSDTGVNEAYLRPQTYSVKGSEAPIVKMKFDPSKLPDDGSLITTGCIAIPLNILSDVFHDYIDLVREVGIV